MLSLFNLYLMHHIKKYFRKPDLSGFLKKKIYRVFYTLFIVIDKKYVTNSKIFFREQIGATLLEQAMCIPVFLFTLFGLLDIATIFRAKSAAKASTEVMLRCLTSFESDCTASSTDAVQERLYQVSTSAQQPERFVDTYLYKGDVISSFIPLYTYSGYTARILDKVYFTAEKRAYTYSELQYDAEAMLLPYLLMRSIPYVDAAFPGSNLDSSQINSLSAQEISQNRDLLIRPEYRIRSTTANGALLQPYIRFDQNALNFRLRTNTTVKKRLQFTVQKPPALQRIKTLLERQKRKNLICLKDRLPASSSNMITPQSCEGFFSTELHSLRSALSGFKFLDSTFGVITINGFSSGIEGVRTPYNGEVTISLITQGDPQSSVSRRDLGGRIFAQGSSRNYASLVPRGSIPELTFKPIQTIYKDEVEEHKGLILPYDTPLTLEITLTSPTGDPVQWEPEGINVYIPEFEVVEQTIPCRSRISGRDLLENRCDTGINHSELGKPQKLRALKNYTGSEQILLGCYPSRAEAQRALETVNNFQDKILNESTLPCGEGFYEGDCNNGDVQNYGVEKLSDESGFIQTSSEALGICNPVSVQVKELPQNTFMMQGQNNVPFWSEKTITLAPVKVDGNDIDCFTASPLSFVPSQYKLYKKLSTGSITGDALTPLHRENTDRHGDPDNINDRSKQYSCHNVFTVTTPISPYHYKDFSYGTIGMEDLGCDWKKKFQSQVSLQINETLLPRRIRLPKMTKLSQSTPDTCTPFQDRYTDSSSFKSYRIMKEQEAVEFCRDKNCKIDFVGFKREDSSQHTVLEAARQKGIEVLEAVFPQTVSKILSSQRNLPAASQSNSSYNAALYIQDKGEEVSTETVLTVPLYFSIKPVKIAYALQRNKERSIVE
jgi:hypothetical protein